MSVSKSGPTEGWERGDFPIVCETCLGENPYVRMMKAEYDKECKICARPFTVFRWKPGHDARYKKTEICQTCAKVKNVCQTCLLDLEFGLPVQVRDAATGPSAIPESDVTREWLAAQAAKQIASGQAQYQTTHGRQEMRESLIKLARTAPYYKRNQAHICSFFVKGECNRGASCPYRHELPTEDSELSQQNMKDRYYGTNDPVAKKILGKTGAYKLTPPADKEIKTLYIGGVDADITEEDLNDIFYHFGELKEIKVVPKSNCAFVTYTTREAAEKAADKLYLSLNVRGHVLRLSWGKPQFADQSTTQSNAASNYFSLPTATVVPPPNPSLSKPFYASMNPNMYGSKRDR